MQFPASLPIEGGLASRWPGAQSHGGQNGKKHAESSHWLSFATMPGEGRHFTELWPAASVASDVERMAAAGEDVGLYRVAGIPV